MMCMYYSVGTSEDPLFSRVIHSGQESKTHCSFNSSQDPSVTDGHGSDPAAANITLNCAQPVTKSQGEKERETCNQTEDIAGKLDVRGVSAGVVNSVPLEVDEQGPEAGVSSRTCSVGIQTGGVMERGACRDAGIGMPGETLTPNLAADKSLSGILEGGCCHQFCLGEQANTIELKYSNAAPPDTEATPPSSNFMPHPISSSTSDPTAAGIVPYTITNTLMLREKDTTPSRERTNENMCRALERQSEWFSATSSTTLDHSSTRKSAAVQVTIDISPRASVCGNIDKDASRVDAGGLDVDGTGGEESGECGKGYGIGCHGDGGRDARERDGERELERLRERLALSESTVHWQCLMIRIYQMNDEKLS